MEASESGQSECGREEGGNRAAPIGPYGTFIFGGIKNSLGV